MVDGRRLYMYNYFFSVTIIYTDSDIKKLKKIIII